MDAAALHTTTRLDLAATRDFTRAGAGRGRRERLTAYGRSWLGDIWDEAVKLTTGGREEGIALAAVGSLARGDCGPLSDYDLVLLHDGRSVRTDDVNALAEKIWYPVWDSGARLDHSVRTLGECRQVASNDLTAAVGLLDLEWISGDPVVVSGVRQSIAHDWRSNARKRLPELIESLEQRHERHGDLTTSIEPDLKEGRGGLRDMTILRALTAAWLADRPHGEVDEAYERLLDVRDALHVVTGRGRDRLGREDQDAVAALLGHPDADAMLTSVVSAARSVSFALDGTMRRSAQSQRARTLRVGPRRPVLTPLGYGLFGHDGEVVLGRGLIPTGDPLLLLRAAGSAARRQLPLAPTTVANLTRDIGPLPTPWPEPVRDAFIDLLASGPGLVQVWEALDMSGVISRWLPEWKAVRSRPQRNAVHRFTVDRHLIETVVEAGRLRLGVDRPDLLLVTALLHDIGKIAGVHDHAVEGAPVAASMAGRMGFDDDDVDAIELLVREHLSLIDLATRRDPQDPQTVRAVVAAVEERADLLEQLRALTEADALAAGPTAWTSWRTRLVDELTTKARAALAGRHVVRSEPEDAPEVLTQEAMDRLMLGDAHVVVTVVEGGARVDVADRDRLGLFADTAGLLAAYGAVVRTARLRTVDGVAANTWHVEVPDGDLPAAETLRRGLKQLAGGDRTPLRALERRRPTGAIPLRPLTRAAVVPEGSQDATVIEVRSPDRPGLLRDIGMTFARFGLGVRSAHVATYAGQTLDTFYLTGAGGQPVAPPAVAQVIGALIDVCDGANSG
ncbi:[protein-PII] uridylyltransferase [Luteipulveratus mongoliensis]|uniref:Bifunctional uridylyltransferase/uridylyl-removing enzyme n=1 Tax=Luteipulveratus mongoliensis TaxID=571913 RepID=A0A0K1JI33_9MICO|nr:[protein-PII] uridylyltransferase [Luteipulveratus mongoliensis]AKU16379.1 protein-PII uridylyltransferase [Luteipulveratus mongoliensis]